MKILTEILETPDLNLIDYIKIIENTVAVLTNKH